MHTLVSLLPGSDWAWLDKAGFSDALTRNKGKGTFHVAMLRPLQDRERGLSGSPLSFTKAAYVSALPTLRMEGDLRHHRGCVNHVSFSESGSSMLLLAEPHDQHQKVQRVLWSAPHVHAKLGRGNRR